MGNNGKRYDTEFRADATRLVKENGRSVASVAKDLGINPQTLRNWLGEDKKRQSPDKARIMELEAVCNLENMLQKLVQVNGDFAQLKQWEKRSYKAYRIEEIQNRIMTSPQYAWKDIVREHILSKRPSDFGASVIDIYLVAYVAETNGAGKDEFFKYVKNAGISDNGNSAQAIWQVGKGDGVYLEILHDNGQVKDWNFIIKWVEGK
jgi:transposase-like protein